MKTKTYDKHAIIVNFFAGPGSGKSTCAADLFARLKWKDILAEYAPEYAKDKVWEQTTKILENQLYVFAKQQHRIFRLASQVDVVITDSPMLLSLIYDNSGSLALRSLILEEFSSYRNLNVFITRKKNYEERGRLQSEEAARAIDEKIRALLVSSGFPFLTIEGTPGGVNTVEQEVINALEV